MESKEMLAIDIAEAGLSVQLTAEELVELGLRLVSRGTALRQQGSHVGASLASERLGEASFAEPVLSELEELAVSVAASVEFTRPAQEEDAPPEEFREEFREEAKRALPLYSRLPPWARR